MRSFRSVAVSLALVVACLAGVSSTAAAHTKPQSVVLVRSPHGTVAGTGITYTADTVVIDSSTVTQQLKSVSGDGLTFTFKSTSGGLAKLAPGKVMFLQGKAVGDVTSVSHSGGGLVVQTKQPAITDLIKSGTVDVNAPITFAGGTLAPETEPAATVNDGTSASSSLHLGASAAAGVLTSALLPTTATAMAVSGSRANPSDDQTFNGNTGPIAYMANLSRASEKLDFTVNYKYDVGGFLAYIQTHGYIDTFAAHLQMVIVNDTTKSSAFLAKPLDGYAHVQWSLARGPDAHETIKAPAFTLPFSFSFPFIVGGLPFFVKVEFQALFTIAITAKNATMEGGADIYYDGSGGGASVGHSSFTPEGTESLKSDFLTDENSDMRSVTPISSGALIAVDAPKISFGIGLAQGLSGSAYIEMISSLGQTTGSVIAGQSCSQYNLDFTVKAGLAAEFILAIPEALLPSKNLYDKTVNLKEPGCGG